MLYRMVHILASGVFFSGFMKDLLCLPRPLSPPLQRITMSGSAALEYGFPSTHSTNAVSVAVYALFALNHPSSTVTPTTKLLLEALAYSYATSIVIGRVYCGMHGFLDVVVGSLLGAGLSILECFYVDDFDGFVHDGSFKALSIAVLIILVLVRIHPEPADDCPCFDDSVAFAGVLCGVEIGNWHFAQSPLSWAHPVLATVPFDLEVLGWPKTIVRTCIGVFCIVLWRSVAKTILLRGLPPIFRIVEKLGLSLPRRFFKQASYVTPHHQSVNRLLMYEFREYDNVPSHLKTDNVIPSVYEIPNLLASIRHPRRSRSISVGPQSEADAYEVLAFRQKKRRESLSSGAATSTSEEPRIKAGTSPGDYNYFRQNKPLRQSDEMPMNNYHSTPVNPSSDLTRHRQWSNSAVLVPSNPGEFVQQQVHAIVRTPSQVRKQDEKEEKEMFSKLEKPRVRYDVEVITKLIVYSGSDFCTFSLCTR